MKTTLIVFILSVGLVSCNKVNLTGQNTTPTDCSCNRVVQTIELSFDPIESVYWTTINECSGSIVEGTWRDTLGIPRPVFDECYW